MAKRNRRAEHHADFAGADAEKEAIEKLAANAAKANKGHNSGEVPDETYDLHLKLIEAAKLELDEKLKEIAALRGVLGNRKKVARKDGVDVDAVMHAIKIKNDIALGLQHEIVSEQRNIGRCLRLLGVPLGHQWSLFADADANGGTSAMDAELQGQAAWRNKEPAENNPFQPGTENFVLWAQGYANAENAALQKLGRGNGEAAAH